jgi:hypothetical protein
VSISETALWWARVRAAGPQRTTVNAPVPRGMKRLRDPESGLAWLVPILPTGAEPAVLDELRLAPPPVDRPNETARVLAACLRCCWQDPGAPIWPGTASSYDSAVEVFRAITMREDQLSDSAMTGALRRLAASGWLLWDPVRREVRLGPRTATWSEADLTSLRELWRNLPAPAAATEPAAEEKEES